MGELGSSFGWLSSKIKLILSIEFVRQIIIYTKNNQIKQKNIHKFKGHEFIAKKINLLIGCFAALF